MQQTRAFDEQWAHPMRIMLTGGTIVCYDLLPESMKNNIPVILVPGWGGTPEMYRDNIDSLVSMGRRMLSVDAPHGIDYDRSMMSSKAAKQIPDAQMRKIAAFIGALDEKKILRVDAIGHSEGCIEIVFAVMLYPERFRNIVLVDPAGMIGEDDPRGLAARFSQDSLLSYAKKARNGRITARMIRAIRAIAGSLSRDPIRAFREFLVMSHTRISTSLSSIRNEGIGIAIVVAADDTVFSNERIKRVVTKEMIDVYFVALGSHSRFQLEPESYMTLIDLILTELCEKHGRGGRPKPIRTKPER